MVATITFKLRSSNHVGIIEVPHRVISCREIKEAIAEKLSGSPDEIDIFVSGSSDYLHPNDELPAYTVVEVVRHVGTGRPPPKREREPVGPSNLSSAMSHAAVRAGNKNGDTATPLTEEERLAQLSEAVAVETGIDEVGAWRMRQMRNRSAAMGGGGREVTFRPPPPGYICHNCGKRGHLIQHCPAAKGVRGVKLLSLPTGIPETMLVECTMDDPAAKFVTRDGRLVKRKLDNASFVGIVTTSDADGVKPDFPSEGGNNRNDSPNSEKLETPDAGGDAAAKPQFLCAWDSVIVKNAMKAPCCGTLFCETCFNERVEEAISRADASEIPLLCPGCEEPLDVPDVVEATEERKLVEALRSGKRARD
ncbi:nucleic acid binding protein, putative [Trypanosoma brucei gambiense DAL972]|uniref:Nucleic acid binding protein, putative n=1 Tax=Trypanosoma brucei gambiense (strain MHOM/CI/86/DAL972) TaxID=679716 RepID=C9ZZ48_TRYB9|nr:nucleic acid binding protein, putative [Trypanosoma brucei gambiense DAL972]CBH14697.1 nucleic acid binding protein, putative [Trypanosoma brucei gambiense DAL972]|eukprot:XP_011776963.1 nucleic acid binding protein, putative [Trypanosoma brucei gambiense DAL972]